MSLVSLAIRIIAQRVLEQRTWADRVIDSPLDPMAELMRGASEDGVTEQPAKPPLICLFTPDASNAGEGRDSHAGPTEVKLTIFIYASPSRISTKENNLYEIEIDNTGSALALNMVARQVEHAFHFASEPWGALWAKFVVRVRERSSKFVLVEIAPGVFIPCQEVVYSLQTVMDPDFGEPVGVWAALDAALRASDPESIQIADLLKSAIAAPDDMPAWEIVQKTFGWSNAAHEAIGLRPVEGSTQLDDGAETLVTQIDASYGGPVEEE